MGSDLCCIFIPWMGFGHKNEANFSVSWDDCFRVCCGVYHLCTQNLLATNYWENDETMLIYHYVWFANNYGLFNYACSHDIFSAIICVCNTRINGRSCSFRTKRQFERKL